MGMGCMIVRGTAQAGSRPWLVPPTTTHTQDRDRRTMLFEERLEACERRRLDGNALFAEGKYTEALAKYAMVSELTGPAAAACREGDMAAWVLLGRQGQKPAGALLAAPALCSRT